MKTCAYCGRENDEHVLHCGECGTNEFKGVSGAKPEGRGFTLAVPPPLQPALRHPIEVIAPQFSVMGWSLWLVLGLVVELIYRPQAFVGAGLFQEMISIGIKGGGILLSVLLIQRTSRRMALMLAGLSLWAFWKFFLGEIVFYMHPELGGFPFATSVANWWERSTLTVAKTVSVVPFAIFILVSMVWWPFYTLLCGGPLVTRVPVGATRPVTEANCIRD